jgi:hypothetical protein
MTPRSSRILPVSVWTISAVVLCGCLSLGLVHGVPAPPDAPAAKAASAFAGRLDDNRRAKLVKEGGGNEASEAAVSAGLRWLIRHQAKDGHWGLNDFKPAGEACNCGNPGQQNDAAGTGLALLPFLARGETHKGRSLYTKGIQNGLTWLIAHQAKE